MNIWCFDTHAFYFWATATIFSEAVLTRLDRMVQDDKLWVSSICFWELALLVKKERIQIEDIVKWKEQVCVSSGIKVIDPDADDMITSTLLPDNHKDPFDRILITQTKRQKAVLVTRDRLVTQYEVETVWPGEDE